jgi:hypothetical protein
LVRSDTLLGLGLAAQCLWAASALAQSPTWPYALQSGSGRIALFSLLREQPAGSEALTQELLAGQGLIPSNGLGVNWAITPGFSYDRNINGGIAADELALFGLRFVTDAATRAKAGWTPTLSFNVSARVTYAEGAVLTAFSSAQSGYSFDHRLAKTDFTTGLCTANYLGMDWFVDVCVRQSRKLRDLAETQETTGSLTVERIFALGASVHSVSVSPQIERVDDKNRPLISLGWRGVYPDLGVLSVNLLHGAEIEGYLTTQRAINLGLTRTILGAPMRLGVTVDRAAGQRYLGIPRIDDKITVTASRQIGTWAEVFAGYETLQSNIDGFDYEGVLFGVTLTGWPPQL